MNKKSLEHRSTTDISTRILALRNQHVMIDGELAQLYGVETRVLVQAVKRNLARFPEDFMFQLNKVEFAALKSQSVISSTGHGGRRTPPYCFTEQGVAMLSSVLHSERAVAVNIEIMRTFVRVRQLAASNDAIALRLKELEVKTDALAHEHETFSQDARIKLRQVFDAIRALMTPIDPPKRPIGFVPLQDKKEKRSDGQSDRKTSGTTA